MTKHNEIYGPRDNDYGRKETLEQKIRREKIITVIEADEKDGLYDEIKKPVKKK